MPPSFSTSNRMYFLALHEYGEDDLLIEEMSGHEAVSQLFEFRLRLIVQRDDINSRIDVRKIIGKPAVLRIETYSSSHMGGERHWNGIVSRFVRTGRAHSADGEDMYTYECDIVPWFWFMTQHEDCRIFQKKSVQEIIETIFKEFAYDDFKFELNESHPTLEYCTQYHETSFDFISRLIEREGIHYYFRHNENEETRHILVFTDNNSSNPALDPDRLPFHHAGHAEDFDAIRTLTLDQQMRTRKITLHDWDYKKKSVVRENTPTVLTIGEDRDLERYRYPGGFVESEVGKHLSKVIMEAEEASHLRFRGDSQIRILTPGYTFTLYDHPFEAFEIKYMVLSVWHHGHNNLSGDSPGEYGNEFTLHPHEVNYRAPLSTPKGLVRGPQTALVTGPAGEEIHTDVHGRIKVQFHWDRQGNYDDKSSCFVRVAQIWAGNGYGTMFIPRVGMEVVVDFLEGDPDQPIVTGCVYNGINMPPYALPAEATKSTIKTLSSKGGGGTNELRFEDKKGSEEVFIQAEKALNVLVKADKVEEIGGDASLKIAGKRTVEVTGICHQHYKADFFTGVDGDHMLNPKGTMKLGSDGDALFASKQNVAVSAKSGQLEMKAMTNIVLEAGVTISLKCGPSSVVLSSSGVDIVGPLVKINSGSAPLSATMYSISLTPDDGSAVEKSKDGDVTRPIQQVQAQALRNAALQGQPFCAECEAARAAYQALMA